MNDVLSALRSEHPWPDTKGVLPFRFALDGGGRELIIDVIRDRNVNLMIEIGCFLNGSVLQWLDAKQDLVVIGIDPWDGDFQTPMKKYVETLPQLFKGIADPTACIASIEQHGPFVSAMANVRGYESRFIPVRARSPEILPELKAMGLRPDLVYIDSTKHREDLDVAFELWPDAIICGDDWTWGADMGFPIQNAVKAFAADHDKRFEAFRATWIIRD